MINKKTQIIPSDEPSISELDFCLNDFRQQKVLTDDDANVRLIQRLLVMKKGTYPSDPDMGVDISSYRFLDIDILVAGELKNTIRTQINKYVPRASINDIKISKLKYKNDFILYIDILLNSDKIKTITYGYLQNSNKNIISTNVTVEKQNYVTGNSDEDEEG